MNREKLHTILIKKKITPLAYSLSGGLPNEKYVLEQGIENWSVYYSERGQKNGERTFSTENDACQYMLQLLLNDDSVLEM